MADTAERDPVCGMEVHDRLWTAVYQGREYVFCSEGCRSVFRQAPAASLSGKGKKAHYDLIIIGGGPAGLTAAVYASLQHIDALLLARELGGQAVDQAQGGFALQTRNGCRYRTPAVIVAASLGQGAWLDRSRVAVWYCHRGVVLADSGVVAGRYGSDHSRISLKPVYFPPGVSPHG